MSKLVTVGRKNEILTGTRLRDRLGIRGERQDKDMKVLSKYKKKIRLNRH